MRNTKKIMINHKFRIGDKYLILYSPRISRYMWFRDIVVTAIEDKIIKAHDSYNNNEIRSFTKKYMTVFKKY